MLGPGVRGPARCGQPLSENTHANLLRELGFNALTQSFRSSCLDYAPESTLMPHNIILAPQAHRLRNKPEAAYTRSDLFAKCRTTMESLVQQFAS